MKKRRKNSSPKKSNTTFVGKRGVANDMQSLRKKAEEEFTTQFFKVEQKRLADEYLWKQQTIVERMQIRNSLTPKRMLE